MYSVTLKRQEEPLISTILVNNVIRVFDACQLKMKGLIICTVHGISSSYSPLLHPLWAYIPSVMSINVLATNVQSIFFFFIFSDLIHSAITLNLSPLFLVVISPGFCRWYINSSPLFFLQMVRGKKTSLI